MATPSISNEARKIIKQEAGLTDVQIIRVQRDRHGYPNLLLEGKDNSDVPWRGWRREGESTYDIDWDCENVDGWPEELM